MVSVLDAVRIKPINLINLFISFGLFLTVTCILLFLIKIFIPIVSLSISFTSGFTCLGILTYFSIRKIFPEKSKKDLNYLWITVGLNILFGSVSILAKSFIASKLYYLIIFEFFLVLIYLLILWLLKMNWLTQVLGIVLLKTTSKNKIET